MGLPRRSGAVARQWDCCRESVAVAIQWDHLSAESLAFLLSRFRQRLIPIVAISRREDWAVAQFCAVRYFACQGATPRQAPLFCWFLGEKNFSTGVAFVQSRTVAPNSVAFWVPDPSSLSRY